jgi:hypothetical protein
MKQSLKDIAVLYSDHVLADADSFSPSARKPRHVLAAWQMAGLPITVRSVIPASEIDLCLAHDGASRFVATRHGRRAGRMASSPWVDGLGLCCIRGLWIRTIGRECFLRRNNTKGGMGNWQESRPLNGGQRLADRWSDVIRSGMDAVVRLAVGSRQECCQGGTLIREHWSANGS